MAKTADKKAAPAATKTTAKTAPAATKAKATSKPAAKPASKLTPNSKGEYPFQLYSVKAKQFVDLAKSPIPVLTSTGRGAYMCKGHDVEGNNLATIVSRVVAENWVERGLAEFA